MSDINKVNDSLAHYGILGMKWGVRRDIGADGLVKTGGADAAIKSERKQVSAARRHLSEGELKKAVERLQTEKKLRDLTNEDVSPGRTTATGILKQIGKSSLQAAGTAVATYAIKAVLEQKFDIKEAAKFIRPKK